MWPFLAAYAYAGSFSYQSFKVSMFSHSYDVYLQGFLYRASAGLLWLINHAGSKVCNFQIIGHDISQIVNLDQDRVFRAKSQSDS